MPTPRHALGICATFMLLMYGLPEARAQVESHVDLLQAEDADAPFLALERYVKVLEHVREHHVDARRTTYQRLVNHSLEGMMSSLDPFSIFYHPETYQAITQDKLDPALPSLGLTLGLRGDELYLMAVAPHGPASRAGLKTGDAIVSIDGKKAPEDLKVALAALSGSPGLPAVFTVRRAHETELITATLIHRVVDEPAVSKARLLSESPRLGYVRLAEFTLDAPRELTLALDDLEDGTALDGLVLDLRANLGGHIQAAASILGEFLAPGTEIFSTRHRNASKNLAYQTPGRKRPHRTYALVVLQDRNSASASELLAGSLQDLERAVIIGTQSFGKGSIHEVLPMGDGTALQLTIATYHTPSGRAPHVVGITPDEVVESSPEDSANFELTRRPGAPGLLTAEEQKILESWADPFLAKATQKLKEALSAKAQQGS